MNKDCACEIRCRVSFAVLSVFSVLPQLLWELTITIFFPFFLQMDSQDLSMKADAKSQY